MKQTKLESLFEATLNIIIGFFISLAAQPCINYICDVNMSGKQQIGSILLFSIVSIIRSYFIRRCFNGNFGKWLFNKLKI